MKNKPNKKLISHWDTSNPEDWSQDGWFPNKEYELKTIIDEILWMAARYAHGRQTFAPSIIRDVVKKMKQIYPEWKPKIDRVIKPKEPEDRGMAEDYLDDIFNPESL